MLPYLLEMLRSLAFSISIETPILLLGLSRSHPVARRIAAGIWLTACTYPIVWITFPILFPPETRRGTYMLISEIFAPVAECFLFWAAFDRGAPRQQIARDWAVIVLANLASFGLGELAHRLLA